MCGKVLSTPVEDLWIAKALKKATGIVWIMFGIKRAGGNTVPTIRSLNL